MMRSGRYILVGKEPVPCEDLLEWARWYETADRRVQQDYVGAIFVSTVFLGLDHSFAFDRNAPPILFETMVFGGVYDGDMYRYSTWEQAELGHALVLADVQEAFAQRALKACECEEGRTWLVKRGEQ